MPCTDIYLIDFLLLLVVPSDACKIYVKSGTYSFLALHSNVTPIVFDHTLNHVQANTCAFIVARSGVVYLVETLENVRQLFLGYANAGILYQQVQVASMGVCLL